MTMWRIPREDRDSYTGRRVFITAPEIRKYAVIEKVHPLERVWIEDLQHDNLYLLPVNVHGTTIFVNVEDLDLVPDHYVP